MPRVVFLVGLLAAPYVLGADGPGPKEAPNYTALSVVNAADNRSDLLAPNAIATIYGVNLAYGTASLSGTAGPLPTSLGSLETGVLIEGRQANLFYISPSQINFLVPPYLNPAQVPVYVVVDGLRGPTISVKLAPTAPALFQSDAQTAIATHLDGTLLTPMSPALPGEIVVLYANGLGRTDPPAIFGEIPDKAAWLVPGADLQILLDGVAVDPSAIEYAGVAPGYAGLYQINLILPMSICANPEIKLVMGSATSVSGVHIFVSAKC